MVWKIRNAMLKSVKKLMIGLLVIGLFLLVDMAQKTIFAPVRQYWQNETVAGQVMDHPLGWKSGPLGLLQEIFTKVTGAHESDGKDR
jgi:hypothetical protein